MLKKISSSVKSIGSKTLILIIALSFAVWGIGDMFTQNENPTIANVGKSEIKLKTFNLEYQTIIDNLRRGSSEPLSEDLIKAMGIHTTVLNNLINQEYINVLSNNAGINVSNKYIKKSIINSPIFKDQLGIFNKDYFNYFLNRNNLSEQELLEINKTGLINDIFIKTINFSEYVPKVIIENISKKRNLARKAYIYEIDMTTDIITEKLTDNEIKKKYNKIKASLLNPEKRNINLIIIDKDVLTEKIKISEEILSDIYNENIESYKKPEQRIVKQIIFDNKNDADTFFSTYENKNDFYNYIKEKNINLDNISLGKIIKGQLDKHVEDHVFSLDVESITKPIESSFGWKVIFLEEIIQQKTKSFIEVKDEIKSSLTTDLISENIYNKANLFYEKFIETNDFNTSLSFADLKSLYFKNITINSVKDLYETNELEIEENELTKIIFNLKYNTISDPIDNTDQSVVFIHIDKITNAIPKSIEQAKNEVVSIIYEEKKIKKGYDVTNQILLKLKNKEKINNKYYNYNATDWLTVDNKITSKIDPKIKEVIFSTKLNTFSNIHQLDKFKFFLVKPYEQSLSILKDENKSNTKTITKEVDYSLENDLLNAMLEDMKLNKKPKVNQQFLESF